MKIKIVTDSSADTLTLSDVDFDFTPLKIITDKKEYVDNKTLDTYLMVNELQHYKGRSSTSCPNAEDWLCAFGDAQYVFCITITGTLSGAYNSALAAKNSYEEQYPDRRVFVFNSLSTGPEMRLVIDRVRQLILEGKDFDSVCKEAVSYSKNTGLLFVLKSMKNLANNGRVSPITAKMAGLLGIRVVGKASDKGDLQVLDKCRGEKSMQDSVISHLKESGLKLGKVIISHCFNPDSANALKERILSEFKDVSVRMYNCRGLCGFYAEKGGLLIGYEKF